MSNDTTNASEELPIDLPDSLVPTEAEFRPTSRPLAQEGQVITAIDEVREADNAKNPLRDAYYRAHLPELWKNRNYCGRDVFAHYYGRSVDVRIDGRYDIRASFYPLCPSGWRTAFRIWIRRNHPEAHELALSEFPIHWDRDGQPNFLRIVPVSPRLFRYWAEWMKDADGPRWNYFEEWNEECFNYRPGSDLRRLVDQALNTELPGQEEEVPEKCLGEEVFDCLDDGVSCERHAAETTIRHCGFLMKQVADDIIDNTAFDVLDAPTLYDISVSAEIPVIIDRPAIVIVEPAIVRYGILALKREKAQRLLEATQRVEYFLAEDGSALSMDSPEDRQLLHLAVERHFEANLTAGQTISECVDALLEWIESPAEDEEGESS